MIRRFYVGVEALSLTTQQKNTLVQAIQQLGANTDPNPAFRNHWRVRNDANALIFEACFEDSQLTVAAFTAYLANVFGVPAAQISSSVVTNSVGTIGTFTYQAVQRLRIVLFGGVSATYAESQAAVLAYLAANSAAWEPVA